MKKLLLTMLALCMVLSVVLVACNDPDQPDVDSSDVTTEAPSEKPTETDPVDPGTTDTDPVDPGTSDTESDTDPVDPPVTPVKVVIAKSWDSMYKVVDGYEADAIFTDGVAYMTWEANAVVDIDHTTEALRVWGWIAYATETEGTVGYSINGGDVIYNEAFTYTAESGVQDHIKNNVPGALSACRMKFDIPTADLKAGEYTFALVAKDPDGNEETIKEFKVTKTMPYVENAQSNFSIDNISLNGAPYVTEGKVVAEMQAKNNTVVVMPGTADTLGFRGWAAFAAAPAVEYGYYIGKKVEIVTDAAYFQDRPDLATANIVNGSGYNITVSIADVPAGIHPVGVIAKLEDGSYAQFFSFWLQIVPECEDATVDLGVRTDGGPFVGGEKKFGQKLPLGDNFLKQIKVSAMATYTDGNENTWSLKIWAWDTDYATTVAGKVLFETTGENHNDNSDFIVDIPFEKLITGDVYYEIEYLTGAKNFTPWTAAEVLVPGVESYVDGNLKDGTYASSVVIAVPVVVTPPAEPKPPVAEGNAEYVAGQANNGGIGNSSIESAVLSEDGTYVTITTPGGDPFFWVLTGGAGIEGVGAIGLKYRTTVDGGEEFDGEFFVGSGGITGGADEVKFEYINDGEWHVIVLDIASYLNAAGKVNYLRYDFFAGSAGSIDIENIVLFDTVVSANAYYGIVVEEPEQPEEFKGNWHASVDSFMYCVNGDFSDLVDFTSAATNSANNGTTITNSSGTLSSITANYIYLANGWLAVDGCSLENFVCNIYAADGTLLKTINLTLREAEEGVLTHVAQNMGYAGVPNRIGQNDGEIIFLGEFAGQTVTVVYSVDAVDTNYTIDLIKIDVAVPAAAVDPDAPAEPLVIDFQNIDDSDIQEFTAAQFSQKVIYGNYGTVVNLGQYDLSLYSKAIIKYATDAGYKTDGLAQIGFKSSSATWGQAGSFDGTDIIASAAMTDAVPDTFWALTGLRDAEIDLSSVDYNGDVWVGAYNVEGQIYAIESITLIP